MLLRTPTISLAYGNIAKHLLMVITQNKTACLRPYLFWCFGVWAVWGACNHAFHLHCILKWVNSQTSQAHCPMCRREWQFKE